MEKERRLSEMILQLQMFREQLLSQQQQQQQPQPQQQQPEQSRVSTNMFFYAEVAIFVSKKKHT